ncbi:HutD family protein [Tetragenococcus koreensis]|nr:HutD family protein [Tetragenococcus koreensis]
MHTINVNNYVVTDWSGGKTMEIFLSPTKSSYQDRTFNYRISSATVEKEHSVFSFLPGYKRIILPLRGPISLVHKFSKVKLHPFQTYYFKGSEKDRKFW